MNDFIKSTIDRIRRKPLLVKPVVSNRTFEYRMIDHDMFDIDELQLMNLMGSKGWEIIRILEPMKWINSDGMFVRIYYKRDKLP